MGEVIRLGARLTGSPRRAESRGAALKSLLLGAIDAEIARHDDAEARKILGERSGAQGQLVKSAIGIERAKALMVEAMEALYAALDQSVADSAIAREDLANIEIASEIISRFTEKADWIRSRDRCARIRERFPMLSPRQVLVANLMTQGLTDKQIASRIGIAWSTVRVHASAVLAKTGTHSRRTLEQLVTFG